jgi:hypothetical protein
MSIDIPLAGWVLSASSFVVGTLIPIIYRRLSHEGMSIKQFLDVRAVTQESSQEKASHVVFSTLLKMANARKETVLLDEIKVATVAVSAARYELSKVTIKLHKEPTNIHLPPETGDEELDFLPTLVRPDEERIIALGLTFRYTPRNLENPTALLADWISDHGLEVFFRINGKYRSYTLRIKRTEAEGLKAPSSLSA